MPPMAKDRPLSTQPSRPKKPPTKNVRLREQLADMLDAICAEKIEGWKFPADVLADDDCPLLAWLIPYYEEAVKKHNARLKAVKTDEKK